MVNEQQRAEVDWYRRHGHYPERIKLDREGVPYVLGDRSWNRDGRPNEVVENRMPRVPLHYSMEQP